MPWVKGQSGNPVGRPRGDATVKELARAHTSAAIGTLVASLKATSERTRVAAAIALLDRGWGQPKQEIDVNHNLPLASATDAALLAIAIAGGSVAAAAQADQSEPPGVVH